jgi:predicted nucleotidyltransferase
MQTPLSSSKRDREDIIARFAQACSGDKRIAAAFVGGSVARGDSDAFSDLDLCIVTRDELFDDVFADRTEIVELFGRPLFLEGGAGQPSEVFAILADGTDLELFFVRETELRDAEVGPIRPLLDRGDILADLELPVREPTVSELAEETRHVLAWFWHDVAHFVTAVNRQQLWWAHGQLEALRGYCVNLVRLEHGVPSETEPYWKIDTEISTVTLEPLRSTVVEIEPRALAEAAADLVTFFGIHGRAVAAGHGLGYPEELERLMRTHLDELTIH